MILIVSGTDAEATKWAHNAGYSVAQWRVVASAMDIAKMHATDHLIFTGTWKDRPDLADLNAAVRTRGLV